MSENKSPFPCEAVATRNFMRAGRPVQVGEKLANISKEEFAIIKGKCAPVASDESKAAASAAKALAEAEKAAEGAG